MIFINVFLYIQCLFSLTGKETKELVSDFDTVIKVEVYAMNPNLVVLDFDTGEDYLREVYKQQLPLDQENLPIYERQFLYSAYHKVFFGQDEKIKNIITCLKKIKPLKYNFSINCRVLLDIYYKDGHKDILYIGDASSQFISYNNVKYYRNSKLYGAILKLLPYRP